MDLASETRCLNACTVAAHLSLSVSTPEPLALPGDSVHQDMTIGFAHRQHSRCEIADAVDAGERSLAVDRRAVG